MLNDTQGKQCPDLTYKMLGSEQATAIQIDVLDYPKDFGEDARPAAVPKGLIQTGMESKASSVILYKQKWWTKQTVLCSCINMELVCAVFIPLSQDNFWISSMARKGSREGRKVRKQPQNGQ